jgi:hypothetical protein
LVKGDGDSFWEPAQYATGGYRAPQSIAEMAWRTGAAQTAATKASNGAWTRRYAAVWAAVNPTTSTVSLPAPAGARDPAGALITTVWLKPASGVILKLD